MRLKSFLLSVKFLLRCVEMSLACFKTWKGTLEILIVCRAWHLSTFHHPTLIDPVIPHISISLVVLISVMITFDTFEVMLWLKRDSFCYVDICIVIFTELNVQICLKVVDLLLDYLLVSRSHEMLCR